MKGKLTPLILVGGAFILSLFYLYPTYKDYSFRSELASLSGEDSTAFLDKHQEEILDARMKRLKLGLDLQGGMRVVLEVDILRLLEEEAINKDDRFSRIMEEMKRRARLEDIEVVPTLISLLRSEGIALNNYYLGRTRSDEEVEVFLNNLSLEALDKAMEIVRNRVDQYRVSEPNIQKQGGRRIIVELPGVKDQREVERLLQGTARLEFRLVREPQVAYRLMQAVDDFLAGKVTDTLTAQAVKGTTQTAQPRANALAELLGQNAPVSTDTSEQATFTREHPFFTFVKPDQSTGDAYVLETDRDRVMRLLARDDIKRILGPDNEFLWSSKPFTMQGQKYYTLYALRKTSELDGSVITDARHSRDPETNLPIVNMEMNREGARRWAQITGANIQKRVAIVLDNAVYSSPVVQSKITGGRSQISGIDSDNEANLLGIILRAGALPTPVTIVEQRVVGPSLGEDSINAGIKSLLYSLMLTLAFMIIYYSFAGVITNVALLFNLLFLFGIMAGFQATFTLPGFAGIVLTIGMAVDANVLINERVREELAGGKTMRAAIDHGYKKAYSAIIDSNVTTFLTGIILYQFGSGPVQGFALTLMIGIACTLFSQLLITRLILNTMTDRGMQPSFG